MKDKGSSSPRGGGGGETEALHLVQEIPPSRTRDSDRDDRKDSRRDSDPGIDTKQSPYEPS